MRRVVVKIDSLVLKGFRFEDRHAIATALQEELAQILAVPQWAHRITAIASVPRMHIGDVNIGADAGPRQVGVETARAIGRGVIK